MGWLCFRLWLLVPYRFHNSRLALWLLPYAGAYAFSAKDGEVNQ